jgi:hypothetical protein
VQKALQQLRPKNDDDPAVRRQVLQKDLAHVEAALARLAHAVAEGGTLATLLLEIRKYEDQRTTPALSTLATPLKSLPKAASPSKWQTFSPPRTSRHTRMRLGSSFRRICRVCAEWACASEG